MTERSLRRRLFRWLGTLDYRVRVSRFYPGRRNAVLMYHAVGDPVRFGNVSPDRLRRDLQSLRDRFEVVDLPAVLTRPSTGPKRVAITFDDAYQSFYRHALPVIRDLAVPVTVFVPVDFVGDQSESLAYRLARSPESLDAFNDADRHATTTVPSPGVMTEAQLRECAGEDLVTLGNHTRTHPDLGTLADRKSLEAEIVGAQTALGDLVGTTVDRFCFPFGRYNPAALEIVRESHDVAVTTQPRVLDETVDPHEIPRLGAHRSEAALQWDLTDLRWALSDTAARAGSLAGALG
jgi:peptidoglycan/xylan/chitin deacetylase (PgdA/CDA1 family)